MLAWISRDAGGEECLALSFRNSASDYFESPLSARSIRRPADVAASPAERGPRPMRPANSRTGPVCLRLPGFTRQAASGSPTLVEPPRARLQATARRIRTPLSPGRLVQSCPRRFCNSDRARVTPEP